METLWNYEQGHNIGHQALIQRPGLHISLLIILE